MAQPRTVLNTLLHAKKRKISGGFYHKMQVDFAYNSNHIEGSRLTHDQTRYIFETHTVDGVAHVDDIIETANHFKCFDYILDTVHENHPPLSNSSLSDCGKGFADSRRSLFHYFDERFSQERKPTH